MTYREISMGILVAVFVIAVLWLAHQVLLAFFAGILFAIFLHRLAKLLRKFIPIAHKLAILLILVLLIVVVAAVATIFATTVSDQVGELAERLPEARQNVVSYWQKLNLSRDSINESLPALSGLASFFSSTTTLITSLLVALVMGIYGSLEPNLYRRGLVYVAGPVRRDAANSMLKKVVDVLWWWLLGRLSTMIVIGALTTVALLIFQVPLALLLGLLAGLLAIIPFLGPIISAIPAVLVALTEGIPLAITVLIIFVVVQVIEGNLITPLVERRTIRLPPALTIGTQLLLGTLTGPLGIMLASPLVAATAVVIKFWRTNNVSKS